MEEQVEKRGFVNRGFVPTPTAFRQQIPQTERKAWLLKCTRDYRQL
ncbi:MAG: hypothetical protein HFI48_06560 [Lachnospiraceae bacterium]|nr:hypothetical protein [Lachnospiraceae bacterium]